MTVTDRIAALEAGRRLESPLADLPRPRPCLSRWPWPSLAPSSPAPLDPVQEHRRRFADTYRRAEEFMRANPGMSVSVSGIVLLATPIYRHELA